MRKPALLLLLWLTLAGVTRTQTPKAIVITDVTVIDGTGAPPKRGMTVVVRGDRITALGSTGRVQVPPGAQVVSAKGKFLMPGLWDMHVHLFNQVSRRPPNTWYFPLFIASGVTSVRDMWTKPDDMEQVREWRRLQSEGNLLAPRIAAVGAIVDGPAGAEARNVAALLLGPTVNVVRTPAESRDFVRRLKTAGIDFVKTYSNLPRETYFAIAEEAGKQGISFAGHAPLVVDAAEASSAGQRSMEHLLQIFESSSSKSLELFQVPARDWSSKHEEMMLDTFDDQKFRALGAVLAKNRTWQVPTLVISRVHTFRGDLRKIRNERWMRYIPADEIASWNETDAGASSQPTGEERNLPTRLWQKRLEVVRRMNEMGVPFLAGTDVGNPYIFPGFSLHDELALLVEAGFTPMQALQAATRNPAQFLGVSDSLGTIEAGKVADLVLLDANPLKNIRNTQKIRAVIVNGRYLDRAALDKLLAEARARAKNPE
ncbi:MAG: amidohydrolase family protein [Candidatus Acidiferrales bacterium]